MMSFITNNWGIENFLGSWHIRWDKKRGWI